MNAAKILLYKLIRRIHAVYSSLEMDNFIDGLKTQENIFVAESVVFLKVPFINLHSESKIILGPRSLINSNPLWLHLAPYSKVHLLADRPGATIEIGEDTRFHASCIRAYKSVKVGRRCLIANNCQIMDASGHGLSFDDVTKRIDQIPFDIEPVIIEDDVWLCEGVTVLPGVTIGRGTIVGARSVVTKSLPSMCMAAGNPAKVVRIFSK
jgi:carbonic anhydrase/acetyltransferase-like protein (isoleucine patch superfamily)